MERATSYGRTPVPASATVPMVWIIPLWMAVVFSPFVAFTVNGVVDDSNWTPAFLTAGVALSLIFLLRAKAAANYAQLPQALRDEYIRGKLFPPTPPARSRHEPVFELNRKEAVVRLAADGVHFSTVALARVGVRRAFALARRGHVDRPDHVIAWRDIAEWEVHDGIDGPGYYRLKLKHGEDIHLHRQPQAAQECALLDAVRSIGQTPVRVFCDIT